MPLPGSIQGLTAEALSLIMVGMEQNDTSFALAAGRYLAELLHGSRVTPLSAFEALAGLAVTGPQKDKLVEAIMTHWDGLNKQCARAGTTELDARAPLLISRGYGEVVPESELKRFLPEEKILINSEAFHARLDSLDFTSLDASSERTLIEQLRAEAIGLSPEDVILYYNLIKVNRLAGNRTGARPMVRAGATGNTAGTGSAAAGTGSGTPVTPITTMELFGLAMKAFDVKQDQIIKANMGKTIELEQAYDVIQENLRSRGILPEVYAHYLGKYSDKYIRAVRDFVEKLVSQRGEQPADFSAYHMLYILMGGVAPKTLDRLELSIPLASYLTDRMGRVRSTYYVGLLFIHTFVYALCSQVSDIALKYRSSPPEQQAKLRKLYSSSERLGLLLSNATTMANQRIAEHKVDAREIQSQFKPFLATHRSLLDSDDLFQTPIPGIATK